MSEVSQGERLTQPETASLSAATQKASPTSVKASASVLSAMGKQVREAEVQRILQHEELTKLPNPVRFLADPESMMDDRFLADALQESRQRSGIFVSGDDPNTFEFLELNTLRTEAGDLFEPLKSEIERADPSRQVLILSGRAISLTEEEEGKRVRRPYHLIRLNRNRAHVERKGISLDLPSPSSTHSVVEEPR